MKRLDCSFLRIFLLPSLFIPSVRPTCSGSVDSSNLVLGFQQQQGTSDDTTSIAHQLTATSQSNGSTCIEILHGMFLNGPNSNCTSDCLVTLTPYRYTNGSNHVDIVMVRPQDASLYPEYSPINGSSTFHCSALKNNCGASIPLYAFVSYDYADHYVGTSSEINDTSYGYDNSGVPLCYLWNVPQDSESVSQISSEYPTSIKSCDVHSFLGLKSTATTKNYATTNTTNNAITKTTNNVITNTKNNATANTKSIATTNTTNNTTVTSSYVVNNNVAGANSSTTAVVSTGNSTQSSISTELQVGSNTTSTLPPSHDDPIGNNSSRANTNGSSNNTWIWVVLGIGVAIAVLATIVMTCLVISNSASTPGNASVSPYRLYTADTIEPPPVPASSMPIHSY